MNIVDKCQKLFFAGLNCVLIGMQVRVDTQLYCYSLMVALQRVRLFLQQELLLIKYVLNQNNNRVNRGCTNPGAISPGRRKFCMWRLIFAGP